MSIITLYKLIINISLIKNFGNDKTKVHLIICINKVYRVDIEIDVKFLFNILN
jgi:hypothetical protein